jgi:predicted  nucleic acid-binding Zn-ribbon protein
MTDWLSGFREETNQIREQNNQLKEETNQIKKEVERLRKENEALRSITPKKLLEIVEKSIKEDTF